MNGNLSGVRIAVFSIYYEPDTSGIAPYATDFCEILVSQGATVNAFVGIPHYPSWTVPRRFKYRVRTTETSNGVTIHRLRHYVPKNPGALRRAGYEVTYWLQSLAASMRHDVDVAIAISPNIGAMQAAGLAARRNSAPFMVILQDLTGQAASQSGAPGASRVAKLVSMAEGRWLRGADLVSVISPGFVTPIQDYGVPLEKIRLLPNYTHIEHTDRTLSEARALLGWNRDSFIVSHTGNMGYKQDLSSVIEAARILQGLDPGVEIKLIGEGAMRDSLQEQARGISNIEFVDPLSQDDYPIALSASNLLLVHERASVRDMSLPSKLTSYLASGRPIVAACHQNGTTADFLTGTKAAVMVAPSEPSALAASIHQLKATAPFRHELGLRGQEFAQAHLTRDAAVVRVTKLVEELLSKRGPNL